MTRLLKTITAFCLCCICGCGLSVGAVNLKIRENGPRDAKSLAAALQTFSSDSIKDSSQIPIDRLRELLQNTTDPQLLPDEAYTVTANVVLGKSAPSDKSFVDALTDFVTSDDFHCRQPIYYDYFVRRYGPLKIRSECADKLPFWQLGRMQGGQVIWIDPRLIRSIHVLFAGNASNIASRFGHVALRLVVCPELDSTDEACDKNLFKHITLGYRAHIDELALSLYKGLTGQYRAHLYAHGFMDTYEEYAVSEFREIYSLPLLMDATTRKQIVRRLADIHWRFSGNYSFFSDNCATQLQDALKIIWPEAMATYMANNSFVRPDSFFKFLRTSPLTEGGKVADLELAESEGFYFPSTNKYYTRALAYVTNAIGTPPVNDIDEYLRIPPLQRRSWWVLNQGVSDQLLSNRHLLEAQLMLEEYAVMQWLRQLMIIAQDHLIESGLAKLDSSTLGLNSEQTQIVEECLIRELRKRSSPTLYPRGIPGQELAAVELGAPATVCQEEEKRALLRDAFIRLLGRNSKLSAQLKTVLSYLEESTGNVNYLKTKYLGQLNN